LRQSGYGPPSVSRPFRFGVALRHTGGRREWLDKARVAEELGYDVLLVADNPMMQAPFPALAAAAAVTSRIRLSPYVINPAVRHPSMLVHELATIDRLSDGRLEIGLGLGNRQIDGLPLVGAGGRPRLLERLIAELQAAFAGDDPNVQFAQERPPIFIAGVGPRLVEIAAASADTFLVSGAMPQPPGVVGPALFDLETAERSYGRVREVAGDRVELGAALQELAITEDRQAAAEKVTETQTHLSVDQVLVSPKAVFGTVEEIADELRRRREVLGISYLVVPEPFMHDLLPIRELL
jgi:probable F420-dependent oxidoreductase